MTAYTTSIVTAMGPVRFLYSTARPIDRLTNHQTRMRSIDPRNRARNEFSSRNGRNTDSVVGKEQQSVTLALSRNFPVGAGKDKWGLGFQLASNQLPNRRAPGRGTWAGVFHTHFFSDPSKELGVIVMMQTLPFYDETSMKVYAGAEEAVYSHAK